MLGSALWRQLKLTGFLRLSLSEAGGCGKRGGCNKLGGCLLPQERCRRLGMCKGEAMLRNCEAKLASVQKVD